MNHMSMPVLILNASYEPLHVASAKKAMKLLWKDVARIEVAHDHEVRPGWPLPSVIRLKSFVRVPHRNVICSRQGVFNRDDFTCQYCGKVLSARALTLDHVIPKSRGGRATWENIVACCITCNKKKADRTPEEAGMVLLSIPREVTIHTARHQLRRSGRKDPAWRKYLYFDVDVESGRMVVGN